MYQFLKRLFIIGKLSLCSPFSSLKLGLMTLLFIIIYNPQEKYQKLMDLLPELHFLAENGEKYLYYKHINGAAPTQTLLMEMLHTKRK